MRPAWGPKLFLVLVTTTIVIGNYQRHRERIYLRGQLVNGHKVTKNITRLQGKSRFLTFFRFYGRGEVEEYQSLCY